MGGSIVSYDMYWKYNVPINFGPLALVFIPYTFFAFIAFFLKQDAFKAWFKFSAVWVPINVLFFLFISQDSSGGWSSAGDASGGILILGLVAVYALVSTVIMVKKTLAKPHDVSK